MLKLDGCYSRDGFSQYDGFSCRDGCPCIVQLHLKEELSTPTRIDADGQGVAPTLESSHFAENAVSIAENERGRPR